SKPSAIPSAPPAAVAERSAALEDAPGYERAAREAHEGGDLGLAVALAREGTRRFAGDARSWTALARILAEGSRSAASVLEKGDFFFEAKRAWERALELAPEHGP